MPSFASSFSSSPHSIVGSNNVYQSIPSLRPIPSWYRQIQYANSFPKNQPGKKTNDLIQMICKSAAKICRMIYFHEMDESLEYWKREKPTQKEEEKDMQGEGGRESDGG